MKADNTRRGFSLLLIATVVTALTAMVAALLDHHLTNGHVLQEVLSKTVFMARLGEFFSRGGGGGGRRRSRDCGCRCG